MQTIPAFYFDPGELARLADRFGTAFRTAAPFQHVVIDDFLPAEVIELLVREFPGPDAIQWDVHGPGRTAWKNDKHADKLASSDETKFAAFTRHFMAQLNSATFLAFLEELTGTKGIIPDVSYSHCGMHSTGRGGRLMMHTDVNRHPHGCKMHQYLNLILYVNPDWREEYGGHLELWDEARRPVHRILPSANRVVIFNTGTRSLHGHPHPLTCPPERRRNSLAIYYYLRDRPVGDDYTGMQRSVHWVAATEEDHAFAREGLARGLERLGALRGRAISVGVDVLPFEVPPTLETEARTVSLYFLEAADAAGTDAFGEAHLRAAIARVGRGREGFFSEYRPIALLGAATHADVLDPAALTCLVDGEGKLYVVRGPDSPELFWVGYLDDVIESIAKAGAS